MASDKEKDIEALNNEEGKNQEKKGKIKYGKSKDTEFGYYKDSVFSKVKYRDEEALKKVGSAIKALTDNATTLKNSLDSNEPSLEPSVTLCGNVSTNLLALVAAIDEAIKKNDDDPSTNKISKKGDTAEIKNYAEKIARYFELLSEYSEGNEKSIGDYDKSAGLSKATKNFVKKTSKLGTDALIYFYEKALNEAAVAVNSCYSQVTNILGIK